MNKESAKDATFILLIVVAGATASVAAILGIGWALFQLFGGAGLAAMVAMLLLGAMWFCIYSDVEYRKRPYE